MAEDEAAANTAWLRARDLLATLAKEFPGVVDYQGDLGLTLGNLAWLAARQGRRADAREFLMQGIAHVQAALKANPCSSHLPRGAAPTRLLTRAGAQGTLNILDPLLKSSQPARERKRRVPRHLRSGLVHDRTILRFKRHDS